MRFVPLIVAMLFSVIARVTRKLNIIVIYADARRQQSVLMRLDC